MTAAIELSAEEFSELKRLTNEDDASAALRIATGEFIRHAKRMRLKALSGQVEMEENWQELEKVELSDAERG